MDYKKWVILLDKGYYYKYKSRTKDINKAKVFTSLSIANKIAVNLGGEVREIYID